MYELRPTDFGRTQNNVLTIRVKGIVVVLFHTGQHCPSCIRYIPVFRSYERQINGYTLAMAHLYDNNNAIFNITRGSNVNLVETPTLVLFIDGIASSIYSGKNRSLENINQWVIDVVQGGGREQVRRREEPRRQQQYPPNGGRQPYPQQRRQKQAQYSDDTGVRIYRTSYGIPYNATNGDEFEKIEEAYTEHV